MQARLPISRWSAWPRDGATSAPVLDFVDPMLRRRLGPLARTLLHVANECAAELPAKSSAVRVVVASQHGELSYAVSMLRALAAGEPVSPATFSLSVHNAPAGIFSIARADRSASTALGAGEETLGQGLLEASCQLEEDGAPVLLLYGDAPLPSEYAAFAERAPAQRVLGVLLETGAARTATLETEPAGGNTASSEQQADAFFRHLAQGGPERWTGGERTWSWH